MAKRLMLVRNSEAECNNVLKKGCQLEGKVGSKCVCQFIVLVTIKSPDVGEGVGSPHLAGKFITLHGSVGKCTMQMAYAGQKSEAWSRVEASRVKADA